MRLHLKSKAHAQAATASAAAHAFARDAKVTAAASVCEVKHMLISPDTSKLMAARPRTVACRAEAPAPIRCPHLQLGLAQIPVVLCQTSYEEQATAGGSPVLGPCQGQSFLQQQR